MKIHNIALLSAAMSGLILASGCVKKSGEDAADAEVGECHGVNECKGTGACQGQRSDGTRYGCSGGNECKGKGWLKMTEKECKEKGGTYRSMST